MPQPWAPFDPPASEWNLKLAGHLLRRTTFGFTADQLQQALADGPQRTIDHLLTPPLAYAEFAQTLEELAPREPDPAQTSQLALYRMLHSPYPLHEKAALYGVKPDAIRTWLLVDPHDALPLVTDPAELTSTILRSNAFFSPSNYRRKVKTPLEFALNLALPLAVRLAPAHFQTQLAALGQREVVSVESRRWLNSFTIIGRCNLAAAILAQVNRFPDRQTLVDTLLQTDAPPQVLASLAKLEGRELVQAIASQPEFQLL